MRPDAARRLDAVVAAVGYCLDITRRDLMGRSRVQHLVQARQLAMAFSCEILGLSVAVVAAYFKRDRATVYHACRITQQRLDGSPRHRDLRATWSLLIWEIAPMMPDFKPSINLLEALRRIVSHRQRQLSLANRQGSLSPEATMLESRQLTALLKRLEALELGTRLELSEPYRFSDDVLADYARTHVLRLIGESRHLMAQALSDVATRLGLSSPPAGLSSGHKSETESGADEG